MFSPELTFYWFMKDWGKCLIVTECNWTQSADEYILLRSQKVRSLSLVFSTFCYASDLNWFKHKGRE